MIPLIPTSKPMKCFFRAVSFAAALIVSVSVYGQQDVEFQISRYEWPSRTSAAAVLEIPQLKRAISSLIESDELFLIIRYSGGVAGNEWALELRDHLVALGIESSRILLQYPSGVEETLVLIVSKGISQ